MLDVHAEALETSSGPYHELLLQYQRLKPIVYGFVEGKDDTSFYRSFIEQVLPDGWAARLICSGNRSAVIDALSMIPWDRFSKKRVCFFIDRDLSDYLGEELSDAENLYITDNYSIENDVVTEHTFCRVMEEVFGITNLNEDEWETICGYFRKNFRSFCEAMTPIMAQILIWRRARARAVLANISLKALFIFKNGELEIDSDYTSQTSRIAYAADCAKAAASDDDALRMAVEEFRSRSGPRRFVRGKYLIWFFAEYAVSFHDSISIFCSKYSKPPKVRLTLGPANAMTIIGPRAKIPKSLKEFIERNYLEYARCYAAP